MLDLFFFVVWFCFLLQLSNKDIVPPLLMIPLLLYIAVGLVYKRIL